MLESFNYYFAKRKPDEVVAALEAMARGGDGRGMATLLKNLYEEDRDAIIDIFCLFLRPHLQSSSLLNSSTLQAATRASKSIAGHVVYLGGYSCHFCQLMSS